MAFILATPHCSAFLSAGDPVTREPMSSLSSVRYWKACESIIASPAIFTSAGLVPSSSGPFGAGRLSARVIPAPPQKNPSATTATLAKIRRIGLLLTPSGHTDSITLYRRTDRRRVSFERGSLLPLLRLANLPKAALRSLPRNSRSLSPLPFLAYTLHCLS